MWQFVEFCEVNGLVTYLIVCGGNESALGSYKSKR